MFKEIEERSILQGEAIQHPTISFVYIFGKQYFCQEHPNLRMNYGTIKQHIRGSQHRLNFETGESLPKPDDPFVKLAYKKVDYDIDSFMNRKKILESLIPGYDNWIRYFLAKYELKGEFQTEIMTKLKIASYLKDQGVNPKDL